MLVIDVVLERNLNWYYSLPRNVQLKLLCRLSLKTMGVQLTNRSSYFTCPGLFGCHCLSDVCWTGIHIRRTSTITIFWCGSYFWNSLMLASAFPMQWKTGIACCSIGWELWMVSAHILWWRNEFMLCNCGLSPGKFLFSNIVRLN